MDETWKTVPYYDGLYEVSDHGRIRNSKTGKDRVLHVGNHGYFMLTVAKKRKPRNLLVHRIVYESFFGPIPKGMTINHKDLNKLNNAVSNLECVSCSVNNTHRHIERKRGVSWSEYGWFSSIAISGKTFFLGRFENKEEAYDAYKSKFRDVYGFDPW